jgi:lysophospholipase L1-like esterase
VRLQVLMLVAGVMGLGLASRGQGQAAVPSAAASQANAGMQGTEVSAKEVAGMRRQLLDWAQLGRYAAENAALGAPAAGERRVVFYGDSITDGWGRRPGTGEFFPGKKYVNRGISGQTTPQMLVRFEQDVVRLRPAAVVILAGTNDVAGNTGPETDEAIEDNFRAMAAVAKANGIRVVLSSITPVAAYPWKPSVTDSVARIKALNAWMKEFCAKEGCVYLDYYSALVDGRGGMREGTSFDGVHPNAAGYAVMGPLAERAVGEALRR